MHLPAQLGAQRSLLNPKSLLQKNAKCCAGPAGTGLGEPQLSSSDLPGTPFIPTHPRAPHQRGQRNMVRHLLSGQHRRVPLGRLPQKVGNRMTAGGSPEMPLCWSIAGSLPSPHCTKGPPEVAGADSSNPLETALRSGERRVEGRGLSKREGLTS